MKITKEDIQKRFDIYNQKYFNGILPKCRCHVNRLKRSGMGTYTTSYQKGKLIGHIWISCFVDWNEEDLEDIIVHEMIHHYVQMIEGHKGGLLGHNWRFKRQCKRLKKEYGLTIHIVSYNVCRFWEKKPTNFIQKLKRRLGLY